VSVQPGTNTIVRMRACNSRPSCVTYLGR
jgi:hypothetical protein